MGVLLDRDTELAELGRRLAQTRAGFGCVILVEGPAGIGKSTLLTAAGRIARAEGATVLHARCSPLEQDAAWGTARQLFEPLRARPEWEELTVGAAGLAERALAPEAGEPAPAGEAMHAAARGLVWLAGNLGERNPALLVVDDVHWADAPSLALAGAAGGIARRVADRRSLRGPVQESLPRHPSLLKELLARAPEPPVRPRTLGPVATETLVRERLPEASAGFAHACHAVTGGNPFLLGALLTQLISDGRSPDDETAARLGTFGSEQVGRVVERQLARLPEGAGELARAIAVLGPGSTLRHAAGLARLDVAAAASAADTLRAAGLLEDGHGLTLAHPLIAGTLYTSLAPGERALRHADAAALLARERDDPERVGLHLLRTEPTGAATTVAALARGGNAGRRARRSAKRSGVPAPCARRATARCRRGSRRAARARPRTRRVHGSRRRRRVARHAAPGGRHRGHAGPAWRDRPERRPHARADRALRQSVCALRSGARGGRSVSSRPTRTARGRARRRRLPASVDDRGGTPLRPPTEAGAVGARTVARGRRDCGRAREPAGGRCSRSPAAGAREGHPRCRARIALDRLDDGASDHQRRAGDRPWPVRCPHRRPRGRAAG